MTKLITLILIALTLTTTANAGCYIVEEPNGYTDYANGHIHCPKAPPVEVTEYMTDAEQKIFDAKALSLMSPSMQALMAQARQSGLNAK